MIIAANPLSLWPLTQRLGAIFAAQGREVHMRLRRAVQTGDEIDLRHWTQPMFDILRPLMRPYWQAGLVQGKRELDLATLRKGLRRSIRKDFTLFANDRTFTLSNPSVLDAIDQATMLFCATTNATATEDLNTAIAKLRLELKEGVPLGEAHVDLARRVQTLFNDPGRARTIAVTEASRATNGGSIISYQRSGVCEGSAWSTTTNPCPEICEPLDGEERAFGEPFVILSKGNPAYRVIMHAPAHPYCYCGNTPVLVL